MRRIEGDLPAARKHFSKIISNGYNNVHCVNLLGKGEGEDKVTKKYEKILEIIKNEMDVDYTYFDYHQQSPKGKDLEAKLRQFELN